MAKAVKKTATKKTNVEKKVAEETKDELINDSSNNIEDELIIDVENIKAEAVIKQKDEELIDVNIVDKTEEGIKQDLKGLKQEFTNSKKDSKAGEDKDDPKSGEAEYEKLPKETVNSLRRVRDAGYRDEKKEQQIKEALENIPTVVQIEEKKVLSKTASQWEQWLNYQKMSPETFREKFPHHKMLPFIEEIIEFKKK